MKKTLEVRGMTCKHCVKKVHKLVSRFEGVSDVSANLQRMEASFECDPQRTDVARIVNTINEFGYTAREKG
jgi:copper ion binding protein